MDKTETKIRVYSGKEPFAFISYAHADRDAVLPILQRLQENRMRLWYDGGIRVGTEWPQVVASHLLDSSTVIFFLSKSFYKSQNCAREAHYAVSRRKDMICVSLDDTEPPAELQMQFSVARRIDGRIGDAAQTARELAGQLGSDYEGDGVTGYETYTERRNSVHIWRLAAIFFAVLALAGALTVIGYLNGWFSTVGVSETTVPNGTEEVLSLTVFKDAGARDILLKTHSDPAIYLCGNTMVSRSDAIRFSHGEWYINGEQAEGGNMDNCDDIASHRDMEYLALVNEGLTDLTPLSALEKLVYLDISGNPVKDLTFLRGLGELRILKLIDIEATDYAVLSELPAMETVYIAAHQLDDLRLTVDLSTVDVVIKE